MALVRFPPEGISRRISKFTCLLPCKLIVFKVCQGPEVVRLLFRLRTGSARFKKICKMIIDKKFVERVRVVQEKMWSIYW